MMDELGKKAVEVVDNTLEMIDQFDSHFTRRQRAEKIVQLLQMHGCIAKCTCPVGFGQVHNSSCPAHGNRRADHTIDAIPEGRV